MVWVFSLQTFETSQRHGTANRHAGTGRPQSAHNDENTDQWKTMLNACVNARGRHFEHLL